MVLFRTLRLALVAILLSSTFGCREILQDILDEIDDGGDPEPTTFVVTVENVSEPGLIDTDRANGIVPLSPGVFALYKTSAGAKAVFAPHMPADEGIELIAEDGVAMVKADQLAGEESIGASGILSPDGPILPGAPFSFEVTALPGYHLQIVTMFVQSNDWFYGFNDGGLPLFDGDDPIHGDVTEYVALYDAGTEADTAPGTGPDQVLAQEPGSTDVGPHDEVDVIKPVAERDFDFHVPENASVIKITVEPK
ncbi:MAG: spondin domain-containing protein [Bacteroidota bacterium]